MILTASEDKDFHADLKISGIADIHQRFPRIDRSLAFPVNPENGAGDGRRNINCMMRFGAFYGSKALQRHPGPVKLKTGDIHRGFGGLPDSPRFFDLGRRLVKLIAGHIFAGVQIRNPFQFLFKVVRIRRRSALFFLRGFQRGRCRRNIGFGFGAASGIQGLRPYGFQGGDGLSLLHRISHFCVNPPHHPGCRRGYDETLFQAGPALFLDGDLERPPEDIHQIDILGSGNEAVPRCKDNCKDNDAD